MIYQRKLRKQLSPKLVKRIVGASGQWTVLPVALGKCPRFGEPHRSEKANVTRQALPDNTQQTCKIFGLVANGMERPSAANEQRTR
jgi:hypothetical protein